jgi:hypothetical protein
MAEAKTKANDASVAGFLEAIPNAQVRQDCRAIAEIMQAAAKARPRMWGTGIVGFGAYTVVYASGKEAEWPAVGFAPRKQNIALYLGGLGQCEDLLAKLGKHSHTKGCLYINRLSDVHLPTFKKLVRVSVQHRMKPRSG